MSARHAELVKTLPPRLIRFFERFPPHIFAKSVTASKVQPALNTSGSGTSTNHQGSSSATSSLVPDVKNPFQRTFNPATGRWHDPIYSLRRQADLVKLARQNGVKELLPVTAKGTEEKRAYREEHGIRMKGTGIGQKVKGHWYERTMRARLDKRREAMKNMPKMIYEWKQLGHGRGWKKYPK